MVDKKSRFVTIVIVGDITFDAFVARSLPEGGEGKERREDTNERGGEGERVYMRLNLWQ